MPFRQLKAWQAGVHYDIQSENQLFVISIEQRVVTIFLLKSFALSIPKILFYLLPYGINIASL